MMHLLQIYCPLYRSAALLTGRSMPSRNPNDCSEVKATGRTLTLMPRCSLYRVLMLHLHASYREVSLQEARNFQALDVSPKRTIFHRSSGDPSTSPKARLRLSPPSSSSNTLTVQSGINNIVRYFKAWQEEGSCACSSSVRLKIYFCFCSSCQHVFP